MSQQYEQQPFQELSYLGTEQEDYPHEPSEVVRSMAQSALQQEVLFHLPGSMHRQAKAMAVYGVTAVTQTSTLQNHDTAYRDSTFNLPNYYGSND